MTRDEFVNLFKSRVDQIIEIVELAPGVLGAHADEADYICFDKSLCWLGAPEVFCDLMAGDTWFGLIEEVKTRNWDRIVGTACASLLTSAGTEIDWYKKPVEITF